MKVYDTDESAIASGARRKMAARIIQTVLVLALMLAGTWAFYALVIAPKRQPDAAQGSVPRTLAAVHSTRQDIAVVPGDVARSFSRGVFSES